jgi:hypothetical protein
MVPQVVWPDDRSGFESNDSLAKESQQQNWNRDAWQPKQIYPVAATSLIFWVKRIYALLSVFTNSDARQNSRVGS